MIVREESDKLIMMIPQSRQELCSHIISLEKGTKVINTDHKRDKSLKVEELMLHIANRFGNPVAAKDWLSKIYTLKARYMRDQLQIILQVLDEPEVFTVANQAMTFCHQNRIHSAVDFKAIVEQHLRDSKPEEHAGLHILNPLSGDKLDKNIQPQKSSIHDYQQLIKK